MSLTLLSVYYNGDNVRLRVCTIRGVGDDRELDARGVMSRVSAH
jgi:hypothetical protein